MVIPESVRKRLEQLEVYLSRLDEMRKLKEENFLKDWKAQDIVVRNFQIIIEACTDIGANIISQKNLPVAETYAQIIETLGKAGILSGDFAEKFKDFVKFRNIIVHQYLKIDNKKVYKNLQRINEVREFIKYIVEYLHSKKR